MVLTNAAPLNLQIRLTEAPDELRIRLECWLASLQQWAGRNPKLTEFSYVDGAGSANLSLKACLTADGVVQVPLVIRMPAIDFTPFLDRRLRRQAAIISWVGSHSEVPVPTVIGAEDDTSIVGRPFMVMERIEGQSPIDFPGYNTTGFLFDMAPEHRAVLWSGALDTLCALHRTDASGPNFLDFPGSEGAGADLGQVLNHWRNSLDWAAEDLDHGWFAQVHQWLSATMPNDAPKGLAWGDARMGNMLFRDLACVAVLDWEVASCAGPLSDLAWWLLFDRIQDEDSGVPRLEGLGSRSETIDRWQQGTSLSIERLHWFEVLVHFQLGITRAKAFGFRRKAGLPTPPDSDPRSVVRMQQRIDRLLGR